MKTNKHTMKPDLDTQIKERPILFSGPMVRAILDGRKTQTRRVIKPQPHDVEWHLHGEKADPKQGLPSMRVENGSGYAMCGPFKCPFIPYGMYAGENGLLKNAKIGDDRDLRSRLWVREAWNMFDEDGEPCPFIPDHYRADYCLAHKESMHGEDDLKWHPSIHMPRWASRITLEVVSVRVERLQDISEEDAKAEGVEILAGCDPADLCSYKSYLVENPLRPLTAYESFRTLWQSINGRDSWEANYWVWVVEFNKIEP